MDRDEIREFLALMTRLAVAMEDQAKHQQEFNEMSRQYHTQLQAHDEEWRQIQIQWREENLRRDAELLELNQQQRALQIQREGQWHKDNLEVQTQMAREWLKNASININMDRE